MRAELFQNGRVAVDRIVRELRAGGEPVLEPTAITFPIDTTEDDVFDALLRFEQIGDRIERTQDAQPPQTVAEKIDSVTFGGTDLTTIQLTLKEGNETVTLRSAVRHAN